MKGGKEEGEEEKISSPMFPRLHVNDTDKGGPRPPPRNKMALYEQLCIPSQRSNSSSSLLPSQDAQNVGSSLKKGNGHEGNVLCPLYSSATLTASVEKVNSCSSDGEDARSREREFERSAIRNMNLKSANAVGSVAECSSLHRDTSNTKNSSWKRLDDDDDFRVPTYVNSENVLNLNKDTSGAEKRMLTTLNSSVQLSSSCKRILEQTSPSDPKSGKLERRSRQKLNDMSVLGEQTAQALAHQEAGEKLAESSRFVKSSSDREPTASCLKSCGNDPLNGPTAQSDPHSKASVSHRSMNVAGVCNQTTDDKENSSLEQSDAERNDDMSDTSMVDSISGLEISPDDVVGVIGPKQFWKARRTIVNQQRVFAIQVFELHRLIKVQKLLAASPHLLLEENTCTTPQKLPVKNLHIESYIKPQPPTAKQIDVPETPNHDPNTEYQTESTEFSNKASVQPLRPSASDSRSNPWCFQPSAHQWLVPIVSPSEGLIYKPYSGPCAPPAGFMTPVYGNYVPNPYVHPSMNPMISSSAIEQTNPVIGPRPNPPVEQNSRSSCNISFPKSDAVTGRPWKVPTSKDSELQGSCASSPCEGAQGEGWDALPLFPIAPNAEASVQRGESNDEECQTRVIKVTPHNARSALRRLPKFSPLNPQIIAKTSTKYFQKCPHSTAPNNKPRAAKTGDDDWNDAWESAWLPDDDVSSAAADDVTLPPSADAADSPEPEIDDDTKAFIAEMDERWNERRAAAAARSSPASDERSKKGKKKDSDEYRVRKQRIHAGLWMKEIEKMEEARVAGSTAAGDDIDRLLDSCSEIFDSGNIDLSNSKIPSTSEFQSKPSGWETTTKTQDGNIWEISQREEDILLQEFERRIAFSKFQIASFIKTHIFSRRRPIDGWKYMIEELGPNAKRGKGSVHRLPSVADPSTQPFKEERPAIAPNLTSNRRR